MIKDTSTMSLDELEVALMNNRSLITDLEQYDSRIRGEMQAIKALQFSKMSIKIVIHPGTAGIYVMYQKGIESRLIRRRYFPFGENPKEYMDNLRAEFIGVKLELDEVLLNILWLFQSGQIYKDTLNYVDGTGSVVMSHWALLEQLGYIAHTKAGWTMTEDGCRVAEK